jgi:hypothetical protein
MSKQFPFQYDDVDLFRRIISPDALGMLPEYMIRADSILPIGFEGDVLLVAVLESCEDETLEKAQFICNREIMVFVVPERAMSHAMQRHFPAG